MPFDETLSDKKTGLPLRFEILSFLLNEDLAVRSILNHRYRSRSLRRNTHLVPVAPRVGAPQRVTGYHGRF